MNDAKSRTSAVSIVNSWIEGTLREGRGAAAGRDLPGKGGNHECRAPSSRDTDNAAGRAPNPELRSLRWDLTGSARVLLRQAKPEPYRLARFVTGLCGRGVSTAERLEAA